MYECFDDAPQTWLRLAITFAADDTAVLVLVGELDHASVFDLHQALDAIEEAGARCVLIDARDTAIDGPGQVLGQAGALLVRSGPWLPYYGIMQFDTADLEVLAGQGRLHDVILHEMGHVLGLGPSWLLTGRVVDPLTDPRYNGPAGVAAYQELGGSGNVPLENDGELGTVLSHWRESVFGDELMTGYLGFSPTALSRLTVAALADQGYGVDLGAADPYVLPGAALRSTGEPAPSLPLHTELLAPVPDV